MSSNYLDLDIKTIHGMLVSKKITPKDLVLDAFSRVEANKELNCFITLNKEEALKEADTLEVDKDNLLSGIPIAIKDNIVTKGLRTTCASHILDNFIPVYDAFVVELLKKNGMIIIGKLNMDEFAFGSSSGTSYFGPVLNPWDKTLVPGGSSGGSAACVASSITPFTLGSDTGGSIRQPSAFCGTVGLKPTYGRVSRFGLVAFASSLDQIGPITRNVYENALLLNAICVKDDKDLTSVETKEDFTALIGKDISNLKIAIPKFYVSSLIDKQILDKFNEVKSLLEKKGITLDLIDIPFIDYAVPLYQIIALGEASSNLARFDGIKYGYKAKDAKNTYEVYAKTRAEGFGDEAKRRIMIGSYMLSGPNAKEYFDKALKIRNSMSLELDKVFSKYDLLIGPTTTTLPYKVGSSLNDAVKAFLDDILTIPVNMAGLPGMSLPIGFSKEHLPIGMQIIAKRFDEKTIYQLASFLEKELNLDLGGVKHE